MNNIEEEISYLQPTLQNGYTLKNIIKVIKKATITESIYKAAKSITGNE